MKKQLNIKIFRLKRLSRDRVSKIIVVGYNTSKVNGGYVEKVGSIAFKGNERVVNLRIKRIAFWLNRGAIVNSKVALYIGLAGQGHLTELCP